MRKLLLTSKGLTTVKLRKEFLKLFDRPVQDSTLLILTSKKYHRSMSNTIKNFLKAGIVKKNIRIVNLSRIKKMPPVHEDVLMVYGGNTFYILDRIRKTGADKVIKRFVSSSRLYLGLSAGSIVVHKTIEIAGWGKEGDKNKIKLKNLTGLGFTNIAIYPHYKYSQKNSIATFKKMVKYPVVTLTDKQALLILGNKSRKIIS